MAMLEDRLNLPLISFAFGRLLGSQRVWSELADSTDVLEPGGAIRVPPAIRLENSLQKITGYSPWRNEATENELIRGGVREISTSVAYTLNKAAIVGPTVYKGASRYTVGYGKQRRWLFESNTPCERRESANLVTSWSGSRWFGCLLLDDYARELMADEPAENLGLPSKPYIHDSQYREILGLGKLRTAENVRIDRLKVYFCTSTYKAAQYHELRDRLIKAVPSQGATRPVFIGRGTDGDKRDIENATKLEEKLVEWGFDVLSPSELTATEIAQRTAGSSLVVGVEGSHLSHAIFSMASGGTLVTLQPPSRVAMPYKEFTDAMDMNFALLIGDDAGNGTFSIDLDELARLLEICGL